MQIRKYAIIGLFAAVLLSVPSSGLANADSIPNWIKTNAAWWAEGKIDQQSFIQGIESVSYTHLTLPTTPYV